MGDSDVGVDQLRNLSKMGGIGHCLHQLLVLQAEASVHLSESSCFNIGVVLNDSAQTGDAMMMSRTSEIGFRRTLFVSAKSIKKWNTAGADSASPSKASKTQTFLGCRLRRFNAFVELTPDGGLALNNDHDQKEVENSARRQLNPRSCHF